ncbi:glutathione hydrolase 1 proenzyme-like [Lineus longissimus]|uniref:glutathione hydrolase 1 proenzyme-like n=1 Tax=Lineus longissimus TaxID=88925 RepID=UPI002B4F6CE0
MGINANLWVFSFLYVSAYVALPLTPPWRRLDEKTCIGKEKSFKNAAVATDNPLCSSVGSYFLEKGGSVVDATVAVFACQSVVDCHLTGLGGGGRMLIYKRDIGKVLAAEASSKVYSRLPSDLFEKADNAEVDNKKKGGAFVAIPGSTAGIWEAHQKFGVLPWKDLFGPAIEIAENGFPMGAFMHAAVTERPYPQVLSDETLRSVFVDPKTGDVRKEGSIIRLPLLAKTLKRLAVDGGTSFYNGSLARDIVADVNEKGGFFELDDLSNYRVKWTEPLKITFNGTFRNLTLYNVPGLSGGIYLQSQLLLLDGYNVTKKDGLTIEGQATVRHRQMQAARTSFCFMSQMRAQDDDRTLQVMEYMRDPAFMATIRNEMRDDSKLPYPGICDQPEFHPPSFNGTSHISIVAPNGDAVAFTSSIHNYLGSTVMGRRTGITFNDAINDFTDPMEYQQLGLVPVSNRLEANATAAGMQAPSIFTDQDGNIKLVTGASGGGKIPSTIATIAKDVLIFDKTVKDATDSPRLYLHRFAGIDQFADCYPKAILKELRKKGNLLTAFDEGIRESCAQSIVMKDGRLSPYSDPRRQGCTDGY